MEWVAVNGFVIPEAWKWLFAKIGIKYNFPTQLIEAFVWFGCFGELLALKGKVKDSTRISIAVITYVLIRMFILEQIYEGYHAFANPKMTILYLTLIIICTTIIIKNKKEKAKEECLNKE